MATAMRVRFEDELAGLNEQVLRLGSLARRAVDHSVVALTDADIDLAREVVAEDMTINRMRYDVEAQCYALIATEQPVAGDLRAIVAALIIGTELERIGDHGKKIAGVYLRMAANPRVPSMGDIPRMAVLSLAMLDRALRAFATSDASDGASICQADDQVDRLYKQTFNWLLSTMLETPRVISPATHLLQIAHAKLERVADRSTNIAERVIYSVTGELSDLNV